MFEDSTFESGGKIKSKAAYYMPVTLAFCGGILAVMILLPLVYPEALPKAMMLTVLTSGLTFLTVLSLYIFGGQVLNGFSFALVVGILIGTYSSIAVAAPMLVAWQQWRASKGKAVVLPAAKRSRS